MQQWEFNRRILAAVDTVANMLTDKGVEGLQNADI
jgi:hypothetical protein